MKWGDGGGILVKRGDSDENSYDFFLFPIIKPYFTQNCKRINAPIEKPTTCKITDGQVQPRWVRRRNKSDAWVVVLKKVNHKKIIQTILQSYSIHYKK